MEFDGLRNKKIVISGGGGFIGTNLGTRLLSLGAEVFLVGNHFDERVDEIRERVQIIEVDINSEEFLEILDDADYLFHLAWQTELKKSMENPVEDLENDIGGLLKILERLKDNKKIKIVFPSTTTVFGLTEELPVNESFKENPLSVYEVNKLMAEKYLQMYHQVYGLKSCILRLSNVFGEGQMINNPNRGVLNYMIGRALRGESLTVYGEGDFIRDYCYIQNYVDAFILAAVSEKTDGEMYVLGSGEGMNFILSLFLILSFIRRIFLNEHGASSNHSCSSLSDFTSSSRTIEEPDVSNERMIAGGCSIIIEDKSGGRSIGIICYSPFC